MDDTGKIVRAVKVASEPEDLLQIFSSPAYHFKRIGLEAEPLSQWLFSALAEGLTGDLCRDAAHAGGVVEHPAGKLRTVVAPNSFWFAALFC